MSIIIGYYNSEVSNHTLFNDSQITGLELKAGAMQSSTSSSRPQSGDD